jgi:hypothetical protein
MKERPILFSGAMVRALLDGSKTQTRRIVKGRALDWLQPGMFNREYVASPDNGLSPYGFAGDRLYVRETWQHSNHPLGPYDSDSLVFYRADYFDDPHGPDGEKSPEGRYREWRPSIHMPSAASRILLEVTGVRIERLQDISEDDAWAEGCPEDATWALDWYQLLWNSLNAARGYGWDVNPWVWVVEFKKVGV